jgi:hypothetical protein
MASYPMPTRSAPRRCPSRGLVRSRAGDLRGSVLHCTARLSRACNGRPANVLKLQGFIHEVRYHNPKVGCSSHGGRNQYGGRAGVNCICLTRATAQSGGTVRRTNNALSPPVFRFGTRLRNQHLKAPFYALKSGTKVPNLIDFACWGADSYCNQRFVLLHAPYSSA